MPLGVLLVSFSLPRLGYLAMIGLNMVCQCIRTKQISTRKNWISSYLADSEGHFPAEPIQSHSTFPGTPAATHYTCLGPGIFDSNRGSSQKQGL